MFPEEASRAGTAVLVASLGSLSALLRLAKAVPLVALSLLI
jgi:hypothetical protein